MYWGYLALFILAIFTPAIVERDYFSIPEPMVEGMLVFMFGVIGFSLSVAKEKQIFRHIKEKLSLEREKHDITKDLSDSYSYIGEANRKIDVLQSLVNKFPDTISAFQNGGRKKLYQTLLAECRTFSKSDAFVLRIIDVEVKTVKKEIGEGRVDCIDQVPAEKLAVMDLGMSEEGGCTIIRSPENAGPFAAFLIFPKTKHQVENVEILKALVAQALAFFMLEETCAQCLLREKEKQHHEKTDRH
jgi:hypothetical protein